MKVKLPGFLGVAVVALLIPFYSYSQPCPTYAGTLTGSRTCNNAHGMLTFHSQSGAGPFIITYTDDSYNTFTQGNVMDGTPFAVTSTSLLPATYTLVSIKDNSGCAATTVAPGITATITPGACSMCTGALGDPVVNVDFGAGQGSSPPLELQVPGASAINFNYIPVTGSPAFPIPGEGQYTITNNVPGNYLWYGGPDHTPGDGGYMLVVNADANPGDCFRQKVTGLCEGGKYEFAAWIANLDNPIQFSAVLPNLSFVVQTEDGTVLGTYSTGDIPLSNIYTWNQYGFFFSLPPGITNVVIRIVNPLSSTVAQGNDFAIDDVTLRPCGPAATTSFSSSVAQQHLTVCEGDGGTLYGTVSAGYVNPQYAWQISRDSGKTWTDIANSNVLQMAVTSPVTGLAMDYYYRMIAADGIRIQQSSCRVASPVCILTTRPLPNADFAFLQDPCTPLVTKFTGSMNSAARFTWTIEGTDHTPPVAGNPDISNVFPSFGDYPVTLKADDGFCSSKVTKNAGIQLQLADVIINKDTILCSKVPVALTTLASVDVCWSPIDYLDDPTSNHPTASPPVTTKYHFTGHIISNNLVTNGDFSAGNTGFASDYTFNPGNNPEGAYFVGTNPSDWNQVAPNPCGDHTSGSGNMMMVNGHFLQSNVMVWSETVKVQPNSNYAFSTWVQSLLYLNPATLQFYINGLPLGSPFTASGTSCQWQQFFTIWNSGSSTTATIRIVDLNMNWAGNDFALDDISLGQLKLQRDSVTITVEDPPAVKAKPDTAVCPGNPVPLQVTGADRYSWTPAVTLSDATSAMPVARPELTTQYIVTGTSSNGCMARDTVDVVINFPPYMRLSPDTAVCMGDQAHLHIEGGASYRWTPAALLDDATSATPTATLTQDRVFYVAITDANGCPETDSVKVYIRTRPDFVQPLDLIVCNGDSGMLGRNDYLHYMYAWTPATGLSDATAARPRITPVKSSQYSVVVSDSTCRQYSSTFQVRAIVNERPIVRLRKLHDIDCAQPITQLEATGAFSYAWSPVMGLTDTTSANPSVSIDRTTTYVVKGMALNGCTDSDTITVEVLPVGENLFIVPNAFSPNGDGHNDCFGVRRWGDVQLEEFSIFTRAGLRVFTTRNPGECWDGSFEGKKQPMGTYVYHIRAKTFCGPVDRMGTLLLVR